MVIKNHSTITHTAVLNSSRKNYLFYGASPCFTLILTSINPDDLASISTTNI